MAYTTIDDPSAYFQTKIYTGNGSTQDITFDGNSNLQPDFLWLKGRSLAEGHTLQNSVSGVTKHLHSQNTDAEVTDTGIVTAFNSDGFSLGDEGDVNANTSTFVGWGWKTGTAFSNDASSTSVGSIDSTGSVNTDAGFSIVKWTGNDANATVAHGLGAVPGMFIVKNLSNDSTGWYVYHQSLGNTKHILLDTAAALVDDINWNDTSPTSTVINLGGQTGSNGPSNSMLAYCFAEKQGYSKFGSYTGNGNANGTFVYTGFKPAWIMIRDTAARSWIILDNKRNTFNVVNNRLFPDSSDAQNTSVDAADFTAQGFKIRSTNSSVGISGNTYIFMAFAENPLVTSTGVPATAR